MMKKVVTVILSMAMVFVCQPMLHVSASEATVDTGMDMNLRADLSVECVNENAIDVACLMEEERPIASYDMTVGGTQTFELTDEEGKEVIVTVSELPSIGRVANGTYQISYTNPGNWEAGYKITVSNNRITSAYDKYCDIYTGSLLSEKLKIDSATQATYTFEYKGILWPVSKGVRSVLNGNKIDVSAI